MAKKKTSRSRTMSPLDWENMSDEEILRIRIRDLGLQIPGTPMADCIETLYNELTLRGIQFRPLCYLADEWLCPDRVPIIGIPFCLIHPRLKRIEQKMMLEVEGGSQTECMKFLRHECGHAINYAYNLHKRTRWRELFGPFTTRYLTSYATQPYSRRYVMHLNGNYAQAHPDEDFAETFAVWLTPDSLWKKKYEQWSALKKLQYIDHLMAGIKDTPPVNTSREMPWSATRMTSTLAAHYERKRKYLKEEFPGYYDASLEKLFIKRESGSKKDKASRFMRTYKRQIMMAVSQWTGERKYDISQLLIKLVKRCDALGLYVSGPESETLIQVTAFVAAVVSKVFRFEIENER